MHIHMSAPHLFRLSATLVALLTAWRLALAPFIWRKNRPVKLELQKGITGPSDPSDSTMVVVIHGWMARPKKLYAVGELAAKILRTNAIYHCRYDSGFWSNADALDLAKNLDLEIEHLQTQNRYGNIVLIGHSIGALLLRKALVCSITRQESDEKGDGSASSRSTGQDVVEQSGTIEQSYWHQKVDRLILLAALNRGWSIKKDPQDSDETHTADRVPILLPALASLFRGLCHLLGGGALISQMERGSPFIANLRLQWIDASHNCLIPPTEQLRGVNDSLVFSTDDKDVQVCSNFAFSEVANSNHSNIVDLNDKRFGQVRAEIITRALTRKYAVQRPSASLAAKKVVFIEHGIRDQGDWVASLAAKIRKRDKDVVTKTYDYGYYPIFRFLFSIDRDRLVRHFMDQFTEMKAVYPNCEVSYFGHSNGTYIVGRALEQYAQCRLANVALAGSVLPRHYPWHDLLRSNQIKKMHNDVAAGDFVVALCPRLFEQLHEFTGIRWGNLGTLGSAGYAGFLEAVTSDSTLQDRCVDIRYWVGSHGAALCEENADQLTDFLLTGEGDVSFVVEIR